MGVYPMISRAFLFATIQEVVLHRVRSQCVVLRAWERGCFCGVSEGMWSVQGPLSDLLEDMSVCVSYDFQLVPGVGAAQLRLKGLELMFLCSLSAMLFVVGLTEIVLSEMAALASSTVGGVFCQRPSCCVASW